MADATREKARRLLVTVLPAVMIILLGGSRSSEDERPGDEARQRNLASFDLVWTTLRESPLTADPGEETDWEHIRNELRPRVAAAADAQEVRAALGELISLAGLSHFSLVPAALLPDMAGDEEDPPSGVSGCELRAVGVNVLVSRVAPGSPAAAAGVRPGWQVLDVDGRDLDETVRAVRSGFAHVSWREGVLAAVLNRRLTGEAGRPLTATMVDGGGERRAIHFTLAAETGERTRFGLLPPVHVRLETSRVHDDIGLIRLNMFLDPARIMPAFNRAVEDCLSCRGLIIDLRGNGGGLPAMVAGVMGWLINESTAELGEMKTPETDLKLVVDRRLRTYPGPVAVLIDELSGSAAEIFAAGIQDLGRGRVFGTRSMGAVLPSVVVELPSGDGFQYAVADYTTLSGRRLEGNGVQPDEEAPLSRRALLRGDDPALDAALAWIDRTATRTTTQQQTRRFEP